MSFSVSSLKRFFEKLQSDAESEREAAKNRPASLRHSHSYRKGALSAVGDSANKSSTAVCVPGSVCESSDSSSDDKTISTATTATTATTITTATSTTSRTLSAAQEKTVQSSSVAETERKGETAETKERVCETVRGTVCDAHDTRTHTHAHTSHTAAATAVPIKTTTTRNSDSSLSLVSRSSLASSASSLSSPLPSSLSSPSSSSSSSMSAALSARALPSTPTPTPRSLRPPPCYPSEGIAVGEAKARTDTSAMMRTAVTQRDTLRDRHTINALKDSPQTSGTLRETAIETRTHTRKETFKDTHNQCLKEMHTQPSARTVSKTAHTDSHKGMSSHNDILVGACSNTHRAAHIHTLTNAETRIRKETHMETQIVTSQEHHTHTLKDTHNPTRTTANTKANTQQVIPPFYTPTQRNCTFHRPPRIDALEAERRRISDTFARFPHGLTQTQFAQWITQFSLRLPVAMSALLFERVLSFDERERERERIESERAVRRRRERERERQREGKAVSERRRVREREKEKERDKALEKLQAVRREITLYAHRHSVVVAPLCTAWYERELAPFGTNERVFRALLSSSLTVLSSPLSCNSVDEEPPSLALTKEDLLPLIDSVLSTSNSLAEELEHSLERYLSLFPPTRDPLQLTEQHREFYNDTMIARIFFCVNVSRCGRLSLTELRKSCFVRSLHVLSLTPPPLHLDNSQFPSAAASSLARGAEITERYIERIIAAERETTTVVKEGDVCGCVCDCDWFSVEASESCWLRFLEIDYDRRGALCETDFLAFEDGVFSHEIIRRIFCAGERAFSDGERGFSPSPTESMSESNEMRYSDFVLFLLAYDAPEEIPSPLSTPTLTARLTQAAALRYWFAVLAIDDAHTLTDTLMRYWYTLQVRRRERLAEIESESKAEREGMPVSNVCACERVISVEFFISQFREGMGVAERERAITLEDALKHPAHARDYIDVLVSMKKFVAYQNTQYML